jgi:hypothetical protein
MGGLHFRIRSNYPGISVAHGPPIKDTPLSVMASGSFSSWKSAFLEQLDRQIADLAEFA